MSVLNKLLTMFCFSRSNESSASLILEPGDKSILEQSKHTDTVSSPSLLPSNSLSFSSPGLKNCSSPHIPPCSSPHVPPCSSPPAHLISSPHVPPCSSPYVPASPSHTLLMSGSSSLHSSDLSIFSSQSDLSARQEPTPSKEGKINLNINININSKPAYGGTGHPN